jgi:alpha-1,6-mannosyltransferase
VDLAIPAERHRLKTLHLTNCWHAASGDIGTFYRALFDAANREGHLMRLVLPGISTSVEPVGRYGRIYTIEAPRAPLNSEYRLVLPHRYLFPRTALQRILNQERPDLVEISDKYALPYLAGLLRTGRLPGVRMRPTVVGSSHERMDENMAAYLTRSRAGRRFSEWFMKWVYFPMFDHHVTVSEHTAKELIRASRGHKVRRGIWVAPMGVDSSLFTPDRRSPAIRQHLLKLAHGNENSTILFYAGRLAPEKNLPLIIETIALLDPAVYRLVIAGTGILLDRLKRECSARGLRHVAFLGHVADRETLADYYANTDIFVHPNPREPFGIAPLEAMSAGVALVAPNSGGVTSYANTSNAWLADAAPAAFADAITAVGVHPARRAARTAAARRTAERHCWPDVTARYLQLYRELHAITQGVERTETIAARTYSTPGDQFGRELIEL